MSQEVVDVYRVVDGQWTPAARGELAIVSLNSNIKAADVMIRSSQDVVLFHVTIDARSACKLVRDRFIVFVHDGWQVSLVFRTSAQALYFWETLSRLLGMQTDTGGTKPKSKKGCARKCDSCTQKLPIILDTVGDRVRNRWLCLTIMFSVFVFAVYRGLIGPLLLQNATALDARRRLLNELDLVGAEDGLLSIDIRYLSLDHEPCETEFFCIFDCTTCMEYTLVARLGSNPSFDIGGYDFSAPLFVESAQTETLQPSSNSATMLLFSQQLDLPVSRELSLFSDKVIRFEVYRKEPGSTASFSSLVPDAAVDYPLDATFGVDVPILGPLNVMSVSFLSSERRAILEASLSWGLPPWGRSNNASVNATSAVVSTMAINATDDSSLPTLVTGYDQTKFLLNIALIVAVPLFYGAGNIYNANLVSAASFLLSLVLVPVLIGVFILWKGMRTTTSVLVMSVFYLVAMGGIPVLYTWVVAIIALGGERKHEYFYQRMAANMALVRRLLRIPQIAPPPMSTVERQLQVPAARMAQLFSRPRRAYLYVRDLLHVWLGVPLGPKRHPHVVFEKRGDHSFPLRFLSAIALSLLFVTTACLGMLWWSGTTNITIELYFQQLQAHKADVDVALEQVESLHAALASSGAAGKLAAERLQIAASLIRPPMCYDLELAKEFYSEEACSSSLVQWIMSGSPTRSDVDAFKRALTLATYAGAFLGSALVLVQAILMLRAYKRRIFELRRGIYRDFDPVHYFIYSAVNFPGLQSVHFVLGFAGFAIVSSALVFVFAHAQTREYVLKLLKPVFQLAVLVTIFEVFSKLMARFVLVVDKQVYHFRAFLAFDFVFSFLSVVSGLFLATLRSIALLLASAVQLMRLDHAPLHNRVLASLDIGYSAYINTLLLDHHHRGPIMVVFCGLLTDIMHAQRLRARGIVPSERATMSGGDRGRPSCMVKMRRLFSVELREWVFLQIPPAHAESTQRRRVRTRWWLAYMLSREPHLAAHRKKAIASRIDALCDQFPESTEPSAPSLMRTRVALGAMPEREVPQGVTSRLLSDTRGRARRGKWQKHFDPGTRTYYWWNSVTGESRGDQG